MKTILRIFIIMVVALVIAGVTLSVVNANGTQTALVSGQGFTDNGNFVPGQRPEGIGIGGPRSGRDGVGGSSLEMVKNIIIVVVFIIGVALVERFVKGIRRDKPTPVPVSTEQPDRKE
jgi:hypothetical protein